MELLSAFRWRLGFSLSLARVWLDLLSLKAKNPFSNSGSWLMIHNIISIPFPIALINECSSLISNFFLFFLAEQVINKFVALGASCAGRFKRWWGVSESISSRHTRVKASSCPHSWAVYWRNQFAPWEDLFHLSTWFFKTEEGRAGSWLLPPVWLWPD